MKDLEELSDVVSDAVPRMIGGGIPAGNRSPPPGGIKDDDWDQIRIVLPAYMAADLSFAEFIMGARTDRYKRAKAQDVGTQGFDLAAT